MEILSTEQQTVLNEVILKGKVLIPSRKSMFMTPELWEKRMILKELCYMNLIRFDLFFASANNEFHETCFVFYSKSLGQTDCLRTKLIELDGTDDGYGILKDALIDE